MQNSPNEIDLFHFENHISWIILLLVCLHDLAKITVELNHIFFKLLRARNSVFWWKIKFSGYGGFWSLIKWFILWRLVSVMENRGACIGLLRPRFKFCKKFCNWVFLVAWTESFCASKFDNSWNFDFFVDFLHELKICGVLTTFF